MLVLSRRVNEEIVIDGRIHVRLLKAGHDRVRLGVSAPSDVPVVRGELTPIDPSDCPNREVAAISQAPPSNGDRRK